MLRIGVNALYLIPGGVGGTEIYLRNLLTALGEIDTVNQYVVFTNRETGSDLVPDRPNFVFAQQPLRASFRPARIIWEQAVLPFAVKKHRLDLLFNPGFTAPIACDCPMVTVFHDLQHKRHPEYFRWFDLPFWQFFLWAAARRSRGLIAVSAATRDDLQRYYGLSAAVIQHGVEWQFFQIAKRREPRRAVGDDIFQAGAEPLFTRLPEIGPVLGSEVAPDVEHDEADDTGLHDRVGPVLHKPGQRPRRVVAE